MSVILTVPRLFHVCFSCRLRTASKGGYAWRVETSIDCRLRMPRLGGFNDITLGTYSYSFIFQGRQKGVKIKADRQLACTSAERRQELPFLLGFRLTPPNCASLKA